jgi:hypothetical protein
MNSMMTSGVEGWAKQHGTESLVRALAQIAATTAKIMREPITFWTITKQADLSCIRIVVDDGDKGPGYVVLLDYIDRSGVLFAPADALPQRFFMSKITEDGETWQTLMLPEEY